MNVFSKIAKRRSFKMWVNGGKNRSSSNKVELCKYSIFLDFRLNLNPVQMCFQSSVHLLSVCFNIVSNEVFCRKTCFTKSKKNSGNDKRFFRLAKFLLPFYDLKNNRVWSLYRKSLEMFLHRFHLHDTCLKYLIH